MFFCCRGSYPLCSEVRTHVVATAVFATGGVRTLTCCTHFFLRTARSLRTSHTSHACHTRMVQGREKVCCIRMSSLLILTSPSPFSCVTVSVCCSGHFDTNLTDALVHTILPNFPDPKARGKRTLHEDEQFGYLAKSVSNTMCCMSLRTMRQQSK